ncbi:MAG: hypothetical protein DRH79_07100, partial [Candidatus Cloacimonadota bacterium]
LGNATIPNFQGLDPKRSESAFGYSRKKRPVGEWQKAPRPALICAISLERAPKRNDVKQIEFSKGWNFFLVFFQGLEILMTLIFYRRQ